METIPKGRFLPYFILLLGRLCYLELLELLYGKVPPVVGIEVAITVALSASLGVLMRPGYSYDDVVDFSVFSLCPCSHSFWTPFLAEA